MAHKLTTVKASSVILHDDGDIFSPLRRLRAKYLAHASWLHLLGHNSAHSVAAAIHIGLLVDENTPEQKQFAKMVTDTLQSGVPTAAQAISVSFPNDEPLFAQ